MATGTQHELQKTFIAMIFAFAVSIVAQQIAELLVVFTNNWRSALTFSESSNGPLLAVATHSLLALLMLSISWVMWSRSQAAGHLVDIEDIFSLKFITFVIEVFLVTMYYSLAKTAEANFTAYGEKQLTISYVTQVSVKPEALQMALIFLIFAFWDFIVDVLTSALNPSPTGALRKFGSYFSGAAVYCSISVICAGAASLVYYVAPTEEFWMHAVAGDLALITVLLIFNRGKILEYYLYKWFPNERSRNNTKRIPTLKGNLTLGALFLIYLISLAFIKYPCVQKLLGW